VVNVSVTCSDNAYALGGTISGLNGSGLVLANSTDTLTVGVNATGFTMPTPVAFGSSYGVSVKTQPTGENCTVSNGSGTMPAGNVTTVSVSCTDLAYSLGGTITGLTASGLVLVNNGADSLTVTANATTFTMPTAVAFGSSYSVTVKTQPAGETCTVSSGTGTMPAGNVNTVALSCVVNRYTLGGTISGLTGSGLVLANGADSLTVAANATSFTMPTSVAVGGSYSVSVMTQPAGENCTVTSGSGTMPAGNVTTVSVSCTALSYTLGGSITGLTTAGLVLVNSGADNLTVPINASSFTMPTSVHFGTSYSVTVKTQPAGKTCTATSATGTMPANNVTSVVVTCV
jgi:hypothetical protein